MKTRTVPFLFAILILSFAAFAQAMPDFTAVDAVLEDAVRAGNAPGVVCLVWHNGSFVYRKAVGMRSLEPQREAMTEDTIFDIASLTKPVATATAVMQLVERGKVRLNDAVAEYLPEFRNNGKEHITVRMLLTHYSGLPEDLDLRHQWSGRDVAFRMAMQIEPVNPPGARFVYSDVNYIVLGFLVERISGETLDAYAAQHIFQPLGMHNTRFLPPAEWRSRIAPTEYAERGVMLRGVVHDPTARRMGGVAGQAGVFSTTDDLALFAQEMLHGNRILQRLTIEKMTTPQTPPWGVSLRGLGWDIDTPFSSNRGELLPVGSFGHTGFTGTSLWIDPVTDTFIVLLANSVHPHLEHQSMVSVRSRVATAVAAALKLDVTEAQKLRLARITGYNETIAGARRIGVRNGEVKQGIDVLEEHGFAELKKGHRGPVRVGLLTNQTGLDAHGRRTIDVLAHAPGIQLTAIFSPEHGATGTLDTTQIGNTRDQATGVPVYSVYGDTDAKRRPPLDVLRTLDAVVFDIQDVGVRYYTYETTLGYFLETLGKTGTELVVLDRVNPVTGAYVQGPLADAGNESFTNYWWKTPIRHGMTMGELARMFNTERALNARLTVVPVQGWVRGDWWDSTGLVWTNPSPNMRSVTEATLYPAVGVIEGTNVSVGRGTDTPFEVVGAPWIAASEFTSYMNRRAIPGVRFVPVYFTPDARFQNSKYVGQRCGGVNVIVTDRNVLDAPELGIELAAALRKLYPQKYDMSRLPELLRNREIFQALMDGRDPREIAEMWHESLDEFLVMRAKYLLY